jgi:dipeptidyl aminopeptidase/acylaminoacyl peptidase
MIRPRALLIVAPLLLTAGVRADEPLQLDPKPQSIIFSATFSKDGRHLALACLDKTIAIHDAKTGKLVTRLEGHTERVWTAAFSPDGATVATCSGEYRTPTEGGAVKLWDLKTGKEKASLLGHEGLVFHVTFSADGKTLISGGWDGTVRLWDVETAREKETLKGHTGPVRTIAQAPDGKSFASASFDGTIRFWDATGKPLKTLKAHDEGVQCLAYSPDGRYLATVPRPGGRREAADITLWDLTTDRSPGHFTGHRGQILSLDFSPDGKTLASGGGTFNEFGDVVLFETASGKERYRYQDHREWIECVKFSPDGKLMVSAGGFTQGQPGEFHAYAVREIPGRPKPVELSAKDLDEAWSMMGQPGGNVPYYGVLMMEGSPKTAVPFLKVRLKPAAPADPAKLARVPQLVASLDEAGFKERERAAKEIEALGEPAAPALRKALEEATSEESKRRLQQLLSRVELPTTSTELLRSMRAIEALEHAATPEARDLLKTLAAGAPEARLTREAQESLKRMAK